MDKQTALDVAYEWLIQHPQVDDEEVDWAREAIQGMIDENSALASWQCLYTDGKEGIVCDDYGGQYCAKQAEIDKFRIALNKSWERNLKQQAEIDELVRWATKIISEEIEHGYTSKQTLDEGQELIAKHKHKGE